VWAAWSDNGGVSPRRLHLPMMNELLNRVRARRGGTALLTALALTTALAGAACGGESDDGSPSSPSSAPSFSPTLLAGSTQVPALAEMLADKHLGPAGAPNVVIAYSSFACSHCADFHTQSLPTLKQQYLDTGAATFVYRDFSLDRTSLRGAMVARCAGDGRFYAVLDVIYQARPSWAQASDPWGALQKILRDAGLSQGLMDACLATPGLEDGILAIRQQGITTYGINATPTFVVNGNVIVGNQPLAAITSYFR
jgi:protein-disulfide isomerase